jgi:hypothetical protein
MKKIIAAFDGLKSRLIEESVGDILMKNIHMPLFITH